MVELRPAEIATREVRVVAMPQQEIARRQEGGGRAAAPGSVDGSLIASDQLMLKIQFSTSWRSIR